MPIMSDNYNFIEGNQVIYVVKNPDMMIPKKDQDVIIKGREYCVYRVDEILNFDSSERDIMIYIERLN